MAQDAPEAKVTYLFEPGGVRYNCWAFDGDWEEYPSQRVTNGDIHDVMLAMQRWVDVQAGLAKCTTMNRAKLLELGAFTVEAILVA